MNFKLALAAAAVVGLAGTANAADLAKKAPAAANYVKVCDAYGAGFFYIPGSDTCLKIGGFVRAEYRIYDTKKGSAFSNAALYGWGTRATHGISTRARADLTIDARTNTEMGLLRSYIDAYFTYDSAATAPSTTLDKAFIQFGGLTAGRASSFFNFYTGSAYGSAFDVAVADANVNLLAYTFSFGNGITASLSIEDPSTASETRRFGAAYGGVKTPDLVANVNITQAWGSAQIMAALHDDYAWAVNKDTLGYAIGAGVKVKLPMLGAGDELGLQAAYAKGAAGYVHGTWGTGLGIEDFYINGLGELKQNSAWSVAGGLTHYWTKSLSSAINASYASYDVANTSTGDVNVLDVAGNIVWAPVAGLTIGAELEYRKADFKNTSTDPEALVGLLRIQRSF